MKCPRCQHETPSDAEFCPECGAKLAPICSQCRTVNAPGHKFCKKHARRGTRHAPPRRPLPPWLRRIRSEDGAQGAGAGASHHRHGDVQRDGHAVLAGKGRDGV
ncbi:MAG: hypothetical protein DME09_08720 [Candidatus Rokuibacteriota bacterium]|nr:MAG: hypothetical protein DME09_08720 [Candidatus Rokubacteria bacterium]